MSSTFVPKVPNDGRTYVLNGRGETVWWDTNEGVSPPDQVQPPVQQPRPESVKKYLVIMAGQSNCQSSNEGPLTAEERVANPKIKALHRNKLTTFKGVPIVNYKVLPNGSIGPAVDPLQHHGISHPDSVGFGRPFAEEFLKDHPNSELIIVPAALGGTGFAPSSGYIISWDKTVTWAHKNLYKEMISDCNDILRSDPSIEVLGMLWHQGESDTHNPQYQVKFDKLIRDTRADLLDGRGANTPVVCGTMLKSWKDKNPGSKYVDQVHKGIRWRFNDENTDCVWLDWLTLPPANDGIEVHFNAAAQRLMGYAYYDVYKKLKHAVKTNGAESSGSRGVHMSTDSNEPTMTFEEACRTLAEKEGSAPTSSLPQTR